MKKADQVCTISCRFSGKTHCIDACTKYGRQKYTTWICIWKVPVYWSVGPRKPSDESNTIVAGCLYVTGWLSGWLAGWPSGYISLSRSWVPTSFPQWPSQPLRCLLFKKANHFTMPHWIFALIQWPHGNLQNRFRRPLNFSASVTHAHCVLGTQELTSIERMYICSLLSWNYFTR